MQAYVDAEGDCEERGISHLPAREVHKIAVLDMRLGNCDRNGGGAACIPHKMRHLFQEALCDTAWLLMESWAAVK